MQRRDRDRVPVERRRRKSFDDGFAVTHHCAIAGIIAEATTKRTPQPPQQISAYGRSTEAAAPPDPMPCNCLSPMPVSTAIHTAAMTPPQAGTANRTAGANPYADAASVAANPR